MLFHHGLLLNNKMKLPKQKKKKEINKVKFLFVSLYSIVKKSCVLKKQEIFFEVS